MFVALIQQMMIPSSEVNLPWKVPDYSQVLDINQDTVSVLLYTNFSLWIQLEMFDEFICLWKEFLLSFVSSEDRNAENLGYFHDDIVGTEIGKRTNFFKLR